MTDIGYSLLIFLTGITLVWHNWNAVWNEDAEDDDFDFGHGIGGRHLGYCFTVLGIILTVIEVLDILPGKWVSVLTQATGIMICIGAIILAKWQYDKTKELFKNPHLTARERRKGNSQYAYIGLSILFVLGLSMIILNF